MKYLALSMILMMSTSAFANSRFKEKIVCEGKAEIQGTLFKRSANLKVSFNVAPDGFGNLGHIAEIDGQRYIHAGDVSSCTANKDEINCIGRGVGNGPELLVKIDKRTYEASGSYFNPKARRMNQSNEYNTYIFDRLICRKES